MQCNYLRGTLSNDLRLERVPEELAEHLRKEFTFPNPAYVTAARYSPYGPPKTVPKEICLTADHPGQLSVPRGVALRHIPARWRPLWDRRQIKDCRYFAPVRFPAQQLTLNAEQRRLMTVLRHASKEPASTGVFSFVMPTAGGKTIFQAAAAHFLGQRTLVLCLTEQIKHVWWNDLHKFCGYEREDIGLIQRSSFTIGKQFTVASVRTLGRRRDHWDEICKAHGTVILDEAQSIMGPTVTDFMQQCKCAYLIGATATDKKRAGNNFILPSLLGDVRDRIEAQQEDTATSYALRDVIVVNTAFNFVTDPFALDWNALLDAFLCDDARNDLIVKKVMQDVRAGFVPLVVTRRLAHAHMLFDMLQRQLQSVNLITGNSNANRPYTSALIEAVNSGKVRCVVATTAAIMLGSNIPALSSLHLTVPVVDPAGVEQLVGRIRRKAPNKTGCRLVYYYDKKVSYLNHLYYRSFCPAMRKLEVPGYCGRSNPIV